MCVSRALDSCCSVCINTLLGLSKLSVNWGGKSRCAALLSHVTNPDSAVENKIANLGNCLHTNADKHYYAVFCPMTHSELLFGPRFFFFSSCSYISPSFTLLNSFSKMHLSIPL